MALFHYPLPEPDGRDFPASGSPVPFSEKARWVFLHEWLRGKNGRQPVSCAVASPFVSSRLVSPCALVYPDPRVYGYGGPLLVLLIRRVRTNPLALVGAVRCGWS